MKNQVLTNCQPFDCYAEAKNWEMKLVPPGNTRMRLSGSEIFHDKRWIGGSSDSGLVFSFRHFRSDHRFGRVRWPGSLFFFFFLPITVISNRCSRVSRDHLNIHGALRIWIFSLFRKPGEYVTRFLYPLRKRDYGDNIWSLHQVRTFHTEFSLPPEIYNSLPRQILMHARARAHLGWGEVEKEIST